MDGVSVCGGWRGGWCVRMDVCGGVEGKEGGVGVVVDKGGWEQGGEGERMWRRR